MAKAASPWQPLNTYVRWRPLSTAELPAGEIRRHQEQDKTSSRYSISIEHPQKEQPWTSGGGAFKDTFEPAADNAAVYDSVVAQAISRVLEGATCNFFAYGHSGSGKTHTIVGYDFEQDGRLGLCLAAARRLFDALDVLNQDSADSDNDNNSENGTNSSNSKLGIALSAYELRKNTAVDLLNGRTECHIRQGPDGRTHIRGATETLPGGKVRVRPIAQIPCWTFAALRGHLQAAVGLRAVGASSVHGASSRTHAVLRLEVVSGALVAARAALVERRSELVPVGKRATDVLVAEQSRGVILLPGGGWKPNPEYVPDAALMEAVEREKAEFEARVVAAEERVEGLLSGGKGEGAPRCLGGKLVFVDLAGSEYQQQLEKEGGGGVAPELPRQTPQEKQEGRQINTDLLALKEVIRACAEGRSRIPFRNSPLTMVLREHFLGSKDGTSAMIVTVSPAVDHYAATLNSLKYGSLVGKASA